jgi:hypothetical protein
LTGCVRLSAAQAIQFYGNDAIKMISFYDETNMSQPSKYPHHAATTVKIAVETITPEIAREYLRRNTHNRQIRKSTVESYAKSMRRGNWLLTHQGIGFDEKGNLIDGQHRLEAVVASGCSIEVLVTRGLPTSINNGVELFTQDAVDKMNARTTSDDFRLNYGIKDSKPVASACNAIAYLCAGVYNQKLLTAEAVGILQIYREQILESITAMRKFKPGRSKPIFGTLAFCMWSHPNEVRLFTEQLVSGETKRGQPVHALRNYLINTERSSTDKGRIYPYHIVCNAVYSTILGEEVKVVKDGDKGLSFFRAKQRTNVEKVKLKLSVETGK